MNRRWNQTLFLVSTLTLGAAGAAEAVRGGTQ